MIRPVMLMLTTRTTHSTFLKAQLGNPIFLQRVGISATRHHAGVFDRRAFMLARQGMHRTRT